MRSIRSSLMFMSSQVRPLGDARRVGAIGAAALALSLAGCSDDEIAGPPDTGPVTFYVGSSDAASASLVSAALASTAGARPPIDPEAIASLEITVGLIEAHHISTPGSATTTPTWVGIPLDPPVVIDPATLAAGEVEAFASGQLPAGDYNNVRLIPESVTVQFLTSSSTTPLVVGNHEFAPAPATHPVTVPSGEIRIPTAHFTVDGNGDVVLIVWDVDETAADVNATGSGTILLRPVFVEGSEQAENQLGGG